MSERSESEGQKPLEKGPCPRVLDSGGVTSPLAASSPTPVVSSPSASLPAAPSPPPPAPPVRRTPRRRKSRRGWPEGERRTFSSRSGRIQERVVLVLPASSLSLARVRDTAPDRAPRRPQNVAAGRLSRFEL